MKSEKKKAESKEVFLPLLIANKERIFLIFISLFMLLLLLNQGGATDLSKSTIWVFRGIAFLAFLFFYLLEYSRKGIKGLPLPSSRQPILKWGSYCLLAFLLINLLTTPIQQPAIAETMNFLMILALMLLVSFYAESQNRINILVYMLSALSILAAAYGLVLYLSAGAESPLSSFFAWHNPAGGYLAASLMIFFAFLLTRSPSNPIGIYGWVGSIIILAALIFTLSRGAWVSMIAAVMLLLILLGIKRTYNQKSSIIAILIIALAVIAIVAIGGRSFLEPVYHRIITFTAAKDFSIEGRENFYSASYRIFQDHSLTGTGLGSFGFVYPEYQTDPRHYAKDPHSFYLRLMSEGGIPGLIFVIVIFWGYFHLLRKLLICKDKQIYSMGAGLVAALTAGLLHLAIDFDDTFPFILLNLGVIWVLGLNLFDPVELAKVKDENEKSTLIVATIKGSSIILVLIIFVGVYHCWRLYNSYSYSQLGDRLMRQMEYSDADQAYNTALAHYPGNIDALVERPRNLIFLHAFADNMEDAENYLMHAISTAQMAKRRVPFSAKSHHVSGKANFQSSDPVHLGQSITDFEAALKRDPMNSPRFYFDTALAYWNLYDMSVPELETLFVDLIDSFKTIYPYDRIEEFARTRMEWIENLPMTWQDILRLEANYYVSKGRIDDAILNLEKAEEIESIRRRVIDETPVSLKEQLGIGEFESRDDFFIHFRHEISSETLDPN